MDSWLVSIIFIGLISYITWILSTVKSYKKLIHISTPEVYGNINNKIKENHNYNPSTPYAVSRTTADLYLKILFENASYPYNSLRASNVYGEYQTRTNFFSTS